MIVDERIQSEADLFEKDVATLKNFIRCLLRDDAEIIKDLKETLSQISLSEITSKEGGDRIYATLNALELTRSRADIALEFLDEDKED